MNNIYEKLPEYAASRLILCSETVKKRMDTGSNPVTPIVLFYVFEAIRPRRSGGSMGFRGVE